MVRYARTGIIFVTVFLVAIAGCSGGPADSKPSDDENVTDPAASPTATASVSNFDYPDGWSADGIESLDQAIAGHYGPETRGQTFTERVDAQRREDGEQTLNNSIVFEFDLDAGEVRATLNGTTYQQAAYYDDGTLYNYDLEKEEITSQSERNLSAIANASRESVGDALRGVELEAEAVVQHGGSTAVRYQISGTDGDGDSQFDEADGTLVVLENGRVSSVNVTQRSENVVLQYRYELVGVGSTDVTRPAWVEG